MKQEQIKQKKTKLHLIFKMLAILAILAFISVLFVGGIDGYQSGMERYQANQVEKKMNLTNLQSAIQLLYGENSDEACKESDDSGLCADKCTTAADCATGWACVNGVCSDSCNNDAQCGDSAYDHCKETRKKCIRCEKDNPYFNGITCTTCPENTPWWNENAGACEACPSGTEWIHRRQRCVAYECRSNEDCKGRTDMEKPYCYLNGGASCSNYNEFYNHFSGVCADAAKEVKASGTVNGRTMYVSSKEMGYLSAERFCKALGKKPVTRDSLGCSGYTTGSWDATCFSDSDYVGEKDSAIVNEISELYKNANDNVAWLDSNYGDSCKGYVLYLHLAKVDYVHWQGSAQALCE